jgi:putative glutamine amidotransferase
LSGFDARSAGGSRRPRPVLGLTTYLQQAQTGVWDVRASFLPAIYIEGVNLAGGIVVLLPPQPVDADIAERVLDGLDGLIITGGRDVDPGAYGQQPHAATDEAVAENRQRDALEFALLRGAIRRGMPVLGICRGAQVLNVALGGTLHQHLPDVLGHTHHQQGDAVFATSSIRTVPGTRVAALVGESSDAQCYHHQAIDQLGEGLMVTARDSDGVIEAVEIPGENFVLAVQWHPEERLDDLRLFAGVVQAAAYATQKVAPGGWGPRPRAGESAGGTPHASGGPTHPQGRGRVRA